MKASDKGQRQRVAPTPNRGDKAPGRIAAPAMPQRQGVPMSDEMLNRYRQSIDRIDAALVFLLAERFQITQAVGRHKAQTGLPPADPGREERQIARLRDLAAQADLDPEFSEKFLRFIIEEVIRHHAQMQNSTTNA
jgi:chorismate mutase